MSIFLKKVIFKGFIRKKVQMFLFCKNSCIFLVMPGKFSTETLEQANYFTQNHAPFHSSEVFARSKLENIHSGVVQLPIANSHMGFRMGLHENPWVPMGMRRKQ